MPCQNAMESTPATLKISEKVRKYHFFPRKSMFVFLKNSTLLDPFKISRWSSVAGRSGCVVHFSSANDYRPTTNDCFKYSMPRRVASDSAPNQKSCAIQTLP